MYYFGLINRLNCNRGVWTVGKVISLFSHASHTHLPNVAEEENYGHELGLDIASYSSQSNHIFSTSLDHPY
jgi:hypothetical protein